MQPSILLTAVGTGLLMAYLLCWCFVMPFTLDYSHDNHHYFITTAEVIFLLLSTFGSIFLISSFFLRSNISDPNLYLFVVMAISDLQVSWLMGTVGTFYRYTSWNDQLAHTSLRRFFTYTVKMLRLISIGSFTAYTFCTAYQLTFRQPIISKLIKVLTFLLLVIISNIYGGVGLYLFEKDFVKDKGFYDATISMFAPMLVMVISMIVVSYWSTKENRLNIVSINFNVVYGVFTIYASFLSVTVTELLYRKYNVPDEFLKIRILVNRICWTFFLTKPLMFPLFDMNFRKVYLKMLHKICCGNCRASSTTNREDSLDEDTNMEQQEIVTLSLLS